MSRRGRPRTRSATGPGEFTLVAIGCFALAIYGIAGGAAAGEEATTAVGVFALACFVLGVWWPVASLARVRLSVRAPSDAAAGEVVHLRVTISGRGRLEVRTADASAPWCHTALPAEVTVGSRVATRGVVTQVRIQLRSAAPLGMFTRFRTVAVMLPRPLYVAPRTELRGVVPGSAPDRSGGPALEARQAGPGETVRAVREYVAGDPARNVHWPTSARRGSLFVREHEPSPPIGIAITADLGGPDPEAAAVEAMSTGAAMLAAGGRVWLTTCEEDGPVGGEVSDRRELGQRLARARPGMVPDPPAGWSRAVVGTERSAP